MTVPPAEKERARRWALENALAHGGQARPEPIVARFLAVDPAWRSRADELRRAVEEVVREVNATKIDAQRTLLASLGGPSAPTAKRPSPAETTGDFPELPGAVPGKVVLRLAPFPSGALHIGHGRLLFVNEYYRERYDGRLLLVFDDTIGSEEKRVELEFFDYILEDCERAGVTPDQIVYKSDRVPAFYPWARRTIERNGAYVCRCPADLLRENRRLGRACPERAQSVATTLEEWDRMLDGAYAPGEAVLRLRTDLADPDPAFRDRVLFRLSDLDHPRVGRRYRVWPMLEFSWAVDDLELGVTHVLRGKELVIEDRMQTYLWNLWGVTGPPFLHWGLLRVREAKVSKSKSYAEVKSGAYDGWSDPRTWSLRSLDRRGIRMEAVRRFILSFGLSLADIEVPAETLYAENRSLIDATTPRRSFVADPVRLDISGYPTGLERVELANHPDRPEMGRRVAEAGPSVYLARTDLLAHPGEEVRLKDLVNIRLPDEPTGPTATTAVFTTRENRRLPRLQWVGVRDAVPVDLLGLDGEHTVGVGERALATATPGEVLQFERVGFVRIERDWRPEERPVRAVFGHP